MSPLKLPVQHYALLLIVIIIVIYIVYHHAKLEDTTKLTRIEVDGKWGYSDDRGNIVIPTQFDEACPFSEGLARVTRDQKSGYINPAGNEIINLKYVANKN